MPWTCPQCSCAVEGDPSACPECGAAKTAWTLVADETRQFVVAAVRFALLKGDGQASEPSYDQLVLDKAEEIKVLSKAEVLGLHDRGLLPPSSMLIFVGLYPQGREDLDLSVSLEPVFATKPAEELSFPVERPREAGEAEAIYAPFVFVRGASPALEGVTLAGGVRIVDLSEGDAGELAEEFAPSVEFTALRRKTQELPAVEAALSTTFRVVEHRPDQSLGGVSLTIELPSGEVRTLDTDDEGLVELAEIDGLCSITKATASCDLEIVVMA